MNYESKRTKSMQSFFTNWKRAIDRMEKRLSALTAKFMQELTLDNSGYIKQTQANMAILNKLQAEFNALYKRETQNLVENFTKSLLRNASIDNTYFNSISVKKTDMSKAEEVIRRRLGINPNGAIKRNGYLGRIVNSEQIFNEIRTLLEIDIANGREFKSTSEKVNAYLEPTMGNRSRIKAYLDTTIRDTYIENDRAIMNEQAKNYELKYFIYAGTIVEQSRCFCIERVGKAFSVEETEKWRDLIGTDCGPIVGIKDESISTKKNNYKPLLDMGGWGCLHIPRYISKRFAGWRM